MLDSSQVKPLRQRFKQKVNQHNKNKAANEFEGEGGTRGGASDLHAKRPESNSNRFVSNATKRVWTLELFVAIAVLWGALIVVQTQLYEMRNRIPIPEANPSTVREFSEDRAMIHVKKLAEGVGSRFVGHGAASAKSVEYLVAVLEELEDVAIMAGGCLYTHVQHTNEVASTSVRVLREGGSMGHHVVNFVARLSSSPCRDDGMETDPFARASHDDNVTESKSESYWKENLAGLEAWGAMSPHVIRIASSQPRATGRPTVLATTHYDSIYGPGAADAASTSSMLLEALRASCEDPPGDTDLMFVWTGAEEVGLLGARSFLRHRWAQDVIAQVNHDSSGPGGGFMLFQTRNWEAYAEWMKTVPYPAIIAAVPIVYATGLVPGETDYSVTEELTPWITWDIAALGNCAVYHTMQDNLANLPRGHIQQGGANLLAMLRHLASTPVSEGLLKDVVQLSDESCSDLRSKAWNWSVGLRGPSTGTELLGVSEHDIAARWVVVLPTSVSLLLFGGVAPLAGFGLLFRSRPRCLGVKMIVLGVLGQVWSWIVGVVVSYLIMTQIMPGGPHLFSDAALWGWLVTSLWFTLGVLVGHRSFQVATGWKGGFEEMLAWEWGAVTLMAVFCAGLAYSGIGLVYLTAFSLLSIAGRRAIVTNGIGRHLLPAWLFSQDSLHLWVLASFLGLWFLHETQMLILHYFPRRLGDTMNTIVAPVITVTHICGTWMVAPWFNHPKFHWRFYIKLIFILAVLATVVAWIPVNPSPARPVTLSVRVEVDRSESGDVLSKVLVVYQRDTSPGLREFVQALLVEGSKVIEDRGRSKRWIIVDAPNTLADEPWASDQASHITGLVDTSKWSSESAISLNLDNQGQGTWMLMIASPYEITEWSLPSGPAARFGDASILRNFFWVPSLLDADDDRWLYFVRCNGPVTRGLDDHEDLDVVEIVLDKSTRVGTRPLEWYFSVEFTTPGVSKRLQMLDKGLPDWISPVFSYGGSAQGVVEV